jgi:hypothetical protein
MNNKNLFYTLIIAAAVILSSIILGNAYKNRNDNGKIAVTGLGETDFVSDLIVWEGNFSQVDYSLQTAYANLERTKKVIKSYLISKGVPENAMVFSSVQTSNENKAQYSSEGKYTGQTFSGYRLSQRITVESKEVEKIENVAREVTELLNQGVKFYSESPRYYYTKLADVKLDLISKATEDARSRAIQIAEKSGANLDKVLNANMGVFQITGQNSNEDYSWGGTFNTRDKNKTASITMKLVYRAD